MTPQELSQNYSLDILKMASEIARGKNESESKMSISNR